MSSSSFQENISSPPTQFTKPKKPPPVTPRSFNRFFTPRSQMSISSARVTSSRKALQDITEAGNKPGTENGNDVLFANTTPNAIPNASSPVLGIEDDESADPVIWYDSLAKKRKRQVQSSSQLQDLSPSKRPRPNQKESGIQVFEEAAEAERSQQQLCTPPPTSPIASSSSLTPSSSSSATGESEGMLRELRELQRMPLPKPIKKRNPFLAAMASPYPRRVGSLLYHPYDELRLESETEHFYSTPDDQYTYLHVSRANRNALPFCTVSCNTSNMVAVGDEDGGIRLFETTLHDGPNFCNPQISLQPHRNALMDICFSPTDHLLATASGDQTACIVDMQTQVVLHTMFEHTSSVKQIKFQPDNDSVIATSGRDGTVRIWDLRCEGYVNLRPKPHQPTASTSYPKSVHTIARAHTSSRRDDISITGLAFLSSSKPHLLLTTSELDARIKLWDIRYTPRGQCLPLSTTMEPESHLHRRPFGLTSLVLTADSSRIYAVCRDHTVYAYSTGHLILGSAPELDGPTINPRCARKGRNLTGLGPIFGFRHPSFAATTFFVKASLRRPNFSTSEMLAVGSGKGTPVLFPTHERYFNIPKIKENRMVRESPENRSKSAISKGLDDTIPIYTHGTALVGGHDREVTDLAWAKNGQLVTISDDRTVRRWKEDIHKANNIRLAMKNKVGEDWGCGIAQLG